MAMVARWVGLAGWLVLLSGWTAAATVDHQREQFALAMEDLEHGREAAFLRREQLLKGYPLDGYLRYAWLIEHLSASPDTELSAFLRRYADWPISSRLRSAWLKQLAGQQRWSQFLKVYTGRQPVALQCAKASAELAMSGSKPMPAALREDISALWLVGHSQPDACDRPFAALKRQGLLSDKLRLQRIVLSVRAGEVKLARYLLRSLKDTGRRRWAQRWLRMRSDPAGTLTALRWSDGVRARELIEYGVRRLANIDAGRAYASWVGLSVRYRFNARSQEAVAGNIALHAVLQQLPDARQWIEALASPNDSERGWALRAALREQDWQGVLNAFAHLSARQQREDHWRYWQARALQALGRSGEAQAIFVEIANGRGYHSFLAADRVDQPYRFGDQPLVVDPRQLIEVARVAAIQRAGELYRLGRGWEARSEWYRGIKGMNTQQLRAAAQLAAGWGWSDRAIATLAKSRDYNVLALRFPLDYRGSVQQQAGSNGLDPSWVYGVIRQESAFIADARSPVGALGLMQVMPTTGRTTARTLRSRLRNSDELKQPTRNIELGTAYLAEILRRLNGNPVLATAAYNAGPRRVERWLPQQPLEASLWVELIPYKETRRYVKAVMAYAVIYDWRRGSAVTPLRQRMPDILPTGAQAGG